MTHVGDVKIPRGFRAGGLRRFAWISWKEEALVLRIGLPSGSKI